MVGVSAETAQQDTLDVPEVGVRSSSEHSARLHRLDGDSDEPEPACAVTAKHTDDNWLEVSIPQYLPFGRWSLCENAGCFGDLLRDGDSE